MTSPRIFMAFLFVSFTCFGQKTGDPEKKEEPTTTFKFGGYVKADFLNTWYNNGDVGNSSPLKDIHFPAQIPVGPASTSGLSSERRERGKRPMSSSAGVWPVVVCGVMRY